MTPKVSPKFFILTLPTSLGKPNLKGEVIQFPVARATCPFCVTAKMTVPRPSEAPPPKSRHLSGLPSIKQRVSQQAGRSVCQGGFESLTFRTSTHTIGTVSGWERRAVGV
ncbi:hypothetical protein SBA2_450069 [Acidobacteriia bacterium SbA2]|nr:hypothetical protein SBA2_450069 [Acidobacteriia bacterium SbA2]